MVDPVEHDRAYRDLPDIRLAARLGGYKPRKEIYIARCGRAGRRRLIYTQRRKGLVPCLTVNAQAVFALKVFDGALGRAAVDAVYAAAVVAPAFQACLSVAPDEPRL